MNYGALAIFGVTLVYGLGAVVVFGGSALVVLLVMGALSS